MHSRKPPAFRSEARTVRALLVDVSRKKETISYAETILCLGVSFWSLRRSLYSIAHDCSRVGEPILPVLVVGRRTGRCLKGLARHYGIEDDERERERCHQLWSSNAGASTQPRPQSPGCNWDDVEFEGRALRFSQVKRRGQQAVFRAAVFKACGGICVVSGCNVPEALEAAHLSGHRWRDGCNSGHDGLLLRRDLHALYDQGLLRFSDDGLVHLSSEVIEHYGVFEKRKVPYFSGTSDCHLRRR